MVTEVKTDTYIIPASDEILETPTGLRFRQIQAIEVKMEEKDYSPDLTDPDIYCHVAFDRHPVHIEAGSRIGRVGRESTETALNRLRWQMVYSLLNAEKAPRDKGSSINAKLYAQEKSVVLQQFIRLHPTPEMS